MQLVPGRNVRYRGTLGRRLVVLTVCVCCRSGKRPPERGPGDAAADADARTPAAHGRLPGQPDTARAAAAPHPCDALLPSRPAGVTAAAAAGPAGRAPRIPGRHVRPIPALLCAFPRDAECPRLAAGLRRQSPDLPDAFKRGRPADGVAAAAAASATGACSPAARMAACCISAAAAGDAA